MGYEIPQQLEYKEKIMFGLTFKQLLYAFIFAPLTLIIFFKTHWHLIIKIILGTNALALGVGFIFLNLETHLKNWYGWYRSRTIELPEKLAALSAVKEIKHNRIITSDNRTLAILKITPINFAIKPEEAKQAITLSFQKFLNALDFPLQILMSTENLDLKEYFTAVKQSSPAQPIIKKLFNHYRDHLTTVTKSHNVLNRTFYVIIPEKTDLTTQVDICQQRLSQLGLKCTQLHTAELTALVARFFEAKTGITPPHIEQFPSYYTLGKTFGRVIYAHGYPRSVETGFLDRIVSTLGNFDVSMHIEPYDIETMMVFLNKELQKQRADLYSAKSKNILNPSLEIKYKDTKAVLENLQKGKEKLFNVSLYINCRATSKKELDLLTKRVESELNSLLIIPRQPYFRMLRGVQSCSPLVRNVLKQPRGVPTAALSAFFPFTSSFLQADTSGVWLGLNKNNIPLIKDIFTLSNPNGVCLASSGSGKSYMAKLLIARYLLTGTQVMVIDPQGEYKALVKRFGGQHIDLSRVSETIINPLDLMGHDYPEKRLSLMDLMPLMLGELSDPQKAILDKAITLAYKERQITMESVASWKRKPPVLQHLLTVLKKMDKNISPLERPTLRSLMNRLETYVNGVFSFLNQRTNIDFNNQFVCFDIGDLPKQVKPVMMFLVLDYIYAKMRKDLRRKLLVIDEAWSLLRQTHDASYIFEIVKTCRKFNMALFLINQEVEGMLESETGKAVLANSAYTLLLRQKPAVINTVKRTLFLSEPEVNHLLTASPGEGILIMDDDHSEIKIVASEEEHKIITTKPDELQALRKQETEEERLESLQKKMDVQRDKRKELEEEEIIITSEERCVKASDRSLEEIDYLKSEGYNKYLFQGILSRKKESYLIKPRKLESPQHIFLVYDIVNYLKKLTDKISTYQTVRPDIVFELKGKEYAIEVETGKMLKFNKTALREKVENLNKKYPDRWFFVITDKNLYPQYKILGETYTKLSVARKIASLNRQ